jgi:phosphoribosyl-ATP pyrophosphohydrolase/phosphoribosyl-AMP cyclohydrolase
VTEAVADGEQMELPELKFTSDGLIPAVAQDRANGQVLMLAYMNRESLELTQRTGFAHYYSRSRGRLWKKGEESGHVQKLLSLHYDCDRDAILARVEQSGPACHKGTATCWTDRPWRVHPAIDELLRTFVDRQRRPKKGSYTNRLLADPVKLRGKLLEECCELIMAVRAKRRKDAAEEAADVLYHFLLLLFTAGVSFAEVAGVLEGRRR